MPRFDGKGPNGEGPMTGWGRGYCGTGIGRGMGFGPGRGMGNGPGRGYGRGWGPGCGWYSVGYGPEAPYSAPAGELRSSLEAQAAFLKNELARTESLLAEAGSDNEAGAKGSKQ